MADLARNATNRGPPYPKLQDMRWHMLTLTSQPDGTNGYRMYVDSKLAGQMLENGTYIGTFPSLSLSSCWDLHVPLHLST